MKNGWNVLIFLIKKKRKKNIVHFWYVHAYLIFSILSAVAHKDFMYILKRNIYAPVVYALLLKYILQM